MLLTPPSPEIVVGPSAVRVQSAGTAVPPLSLTRCLTSDRLEATTTVGGGSGFVAGRTSCPPEPPPPPQAERTAVVRSSQGSALRTVRLSPDGAHTLCRDGCSAACFLLGKIVGMSGPFLLLGLRDQGVPLPPKFLPRSRLESRSLDWFTSSGSRRSRTRAGRLSNGCRNQKTPVNVDRFVLVQLDSIDLRRFEVKQTGPNQNIALPARLGNQKGSVFALLCRDRSSYRFFFYRLTVLLFPSVTYCYLT